MKKTYYVIRQGWNAANQSSSGRSQTPANDFQSNRLKLVQIVEAESKEEAVNSFTGSLYSNQFLFATDNPRSIKGLVQAIRDYNRIMSEANSY